MINQNQRNKEETQTRDLITYKGTEIITGESYSKTHDERIGGTEGNVGFREDLTDEKEWTGSEKNEEEEDQEAKALNGRSHPDRITRLGYIWPKESYINRLWKRF